MAVVKVIELMSDSKKSWDDAVQQAITQASKSIRNIKSVNINNMSCTVDKKGKIAAYRVNCSITFEIE
ncbi:MAG: dodecin domain-containing protein [Chitinophagales bacterium]|nr:dodecin domain-containing protein [Chitinophagales bacterium]